jgi:beta-glucanase (GH16 family)
VYSVRWDESVLEWYVDGVQHHNLDLTAASQSEFHQEFFMILNLAVGGNFPGRPGRQTSFPATLEVDWVRVYQ